jgi:hypothetical protein
MLLFLVGTFLLESISSSFYARVFCTKGFAQLSLDTFQLCNFWHLNIGKKSVRKNVDEIDAFLGTLYRI